MDIRHWSAKWGRAMDISAFQVEGDAEKVAYPAYFDRTTPCLVSFTRMLVALYNVERRRKV